MSKPAQRWIDRLRPPSRRADLGDDGAVFSYLGGMRGPHWYTTLPLVGRVRLFGSNASWPLARLEILPTGIRMRPSTRLLRPWVPQWEVRFDEIREVQAVGRIWWVSTGIRIRTESYEDWIVFWTVNRTHVLSSIAAFGVTVSRTPKRFYFFSPGR